MLVGNMATYSARARYLPIVVEKIAPQLDRLNIVLNRYESVPDFLRRHDNVVPIMPPSDLADTGKFWPDVSAAALVFLLDDDILYPDDYVERSCGLIAAMPAGRAAYSYHGVLYRRCKLTWSPSSVRNLLKSRREVARWKTLLEHDLALEAPTIVDELGTGVAVVAPALLPPFDYMKSAQRFADVRMARWCFENGVTPICLPKELNWLTEIRYRNGIYQTFSQTFPRNVASEINTYAFKTARRGHRLSLDGASPAAADQESPARTALKQLG